MLRVMENFNFEPERYEIENNFICQPGQIVSLKVKEVDYRKKIFLDICDGLHPVGIIDDIRTKSHRNVVFKKEIRIPKSKDKFLIRLDKNIIKNSFYLKESIHYNIKYDLDYASGQLLLDPTQSEELLEIYYAYNSKEGLLESSMNENMGHVWAKHGIFSTNMFDVRSMVYAKKGSKLGVTNGLLTVVMDDNKLFPSIGYILELPTYEKPELKFLFDLKNQISVNYK